jgi:hypothetical protein
MEFGPSRRIFVFMTTRKVGVIWSLSIAALLGCVIGYVLRKAAEEQCQSDVRFVDQAIESFENEGGLIAL